MSRFSYCIALFLISFAQSGVVVFASDGVPEEHLEERSLEVVGASVPPSRLGFLDSCFQSGLAYIHEIPARMNYLRHTYRKNMPGLKVDISYDDAKEEAEKANMTPEKVFDAAWEKGVERATACKQQSGSSRLQNSGVDRAFFLAKENCLHIKLEEIRRKYGSDVSEERAREQACLELEHELSALGSEEFKTRYFPQQKMSERFAQFKKEHASYIKSILARDGGEITEDEVADVLWQQHEALQAEKMRKAALSPRPSVVHAAIKNGWAEAAIDIARTINELNVTYAQKPSVQHIIDPVQKQEYLAQTEQEGTEQKVSAAKREKILRKASMGVSMAGGFLRAVHDADSDLSDASLVTFFSIFDPQATFEGSDSSLQYAQAFKEGTLCFLEQWYASDYLRKRIHKPGNVLFEKELWQEVSRNPVMRKHGQLMIINLFKGWGLPWLRANLNEYAGELKNSVSNFANDGDRSTIFDPLIALANNDLLYAMFLRHFDLKFMFDLMLPIVLLRVHFNVHMPELEIYLAANIFIRALYMCVNLAAFLLQEASKPYVKTANEKFPCIPLMSAFLVRIARAGAAFNWLNPLTDEALHALCLVTQGSLLSLNAFLRSYDRGNVDDWVTDFVASSIPFDIPLVFVLKNIVNQLGEKVQFAQAIKDGSPAYLFCNPSSDVSGYALAFQEKASLPWAEKMRSLKDVVTVIQVNQVVVESTNVARKQRFDELAAATGKG